jgi:hypothetical protein
MVDIRSIAGSSHPSHHEQGTGQEATSRSRVGRSHWMNAYGATTAVWATAATAHWQLSAAAAVMMPLGAGPEATLVEAHQLLHNPPRACASPSVIEQWRHDVD